MSQTHECGGDAAAYVLGALDSHELTAFRRHLATCSVCTEDVASLEQLTSALPMSAPQYPASKHLRRSLMAEVNADVRAQRGTSAVSSPSGLFPKGRPSWASNRGPRYLPGVVGGFAALVLVLVVVVAGITAGGSSTHGKSVGSSRVFQASVGSGTFVASQHQLIVHKLAALPETSTYEVWLKHGSSAPQPTNVLFNTNSTGDDAVKVPGDLLKGVTEILVTKEAADGSAVPTGKVLVDTHLS